MRRVGVCAAMLLAGAGLVIGVAGCGSKSASDELQGPGWEALAEFQKLGGYGRREGGAPDAPVLELYLNGNRITNASLGRLKEFDDLSYLGITMCSEVSDEGLDQLTGLASLRLLYLDDTPITDDGMKHLEQLGSLKCLSLTHTQVTDAALEHVAKLTRLETLHLGDTRITDVGLAHLEGLTNLHELSLPGTQITDAGLKHLSGLPKLTEVWLDRTNVTDVGLECLKPLAGLRLLTVVHTQITPEGIHALCEVLPDCLVHDGRFREPAFATQGP